MHGLAQTLAPFTVAGLFALVFWQGWYWRGARDRRRRRGSRPGYVVRLPRASATVKVTTDATRERLGTSTASKTPTAATAGRVGSAEPVKTSSRTECGNATASSPGVPMTAAEIVAEVNAGTYHLRPRVDRLTGKIIGE